MADKFLVYGATGGIGEAFYALGDPALTVAARLLPGVLTTTRAIGNCMLHLVRMEGARPSTIDNAAIARICD